MAITRVRSALIAGIWLLAATPAVAQDAASSTDPAVPSTVAVVPPGGTLLGKAYPEWVADWWGWVLTVPPESTPPALDCQAGERGEVFFMPYPLPEAMGTATTCSVGVDQPILVSAGQALRHDQSCGATEEELRACIEEDLAAISDLSVTVDGQAIEGVEAYRVESPVFEWVWTESQAGEPGTTATGMVGGWFLMLEPLAPGSHTIEVANTITDDEGTATPFVLDATIEVG
jgi:hypothetical protein